MIALIEVESKVLRMDSRLSNYESTISLCNVNINHVNASSNIWKAVSNSNIDAFHLDSDQIVQCEEDSQIWALLIDIKTLIGKYTREALKPKSFEGPLKWIYCL